MKTMKTCLECGEGKGDGIFCEECQNYISSKKAKELKRKGIMLCPFCEEDGCNNELLTIKGGGIIVPRATIALISLKKYSRQILTG